VIGTSTEVEDYSQNDQACVRGSIGKRGIVGRKTINQKKFNLLTRDGDDLN